MRGIKIILLIFAMIFIFTYMVIDTWDSTKKDPVQTEAEADIILEPAVDSLPVRVFANALMALSIAYTLNLVLIFMHKREKPIHDDQLLSGSCTEFVIQNPEAELQRRTQHFRPL